MNSGLSRVDALCLGQFGGQLRVGALHFSQSEGPHICCLSGALTPPFLRRYVASCVRTVCTSVIHVVTVLLLCPLTPSFFLSASAVSSLVLVSALPCLSSRLLPG